MPLTKVLTDHLKEIKALIQSNVAPKEIMSVEEAANYLGVDAQYLYRNKTIPKYQPSNKLIRFRKSDLDRWLNSFRLSTKQEISELADKKISALKKKRTK